MDMSLGNRTEASPRMRVDALCPGKRARGEGGQALLEFAFLLPVLLLILFGVIVFGMALNNYLELTNGATAGAQALAISRGQALDPCATVTAPFYAAAYNLTQANVKFTITISPPPGGSGSTYVLASDVANPTCAAPNNGSPPATDLTQGATATVKVTYPCNLNFFGFNFAPPTCTLTAQTAESIQ